MEIKRKLIERSTIEAFAEKHELTMEVNERNLAEMNHLDESARYYAHFHRSDISDGRMLRGAFGNGATEEEAISNYAPEISGKLLVINAMTPERKEIRVPILVAP